MPSPEAEARREIDRQLVACGWVVQDFGKMNLSAAQGVAVREFKLQTGPVDYLLSFFSREMCSSIERTVPSWLERLQCTMAVRSTAHSPPT